MRAFFLSKVYDAPEMLDAYRYFLSGQSYAEYVAQHELLWIKSRKFPNTCTNHLDS
jgi:hypothetical protein